MTPSRRSFLKAGTVISLSAAVPKIVSGKLPPAPADPADELSHLSLEQFRKHVGSTFRISSRSRSATVELVTVDDGENRRAQRGGSCFTLLFRDPSSSELPQDLYTLRHGTLGTFPLLLVPAGRGPSGTGLEGVINRLA